MPTPISGYIYLIGNCRYGWYKIGKSQTPEIRIQNLGILLPFKIRVYSVWSVIGDLTRAERDMHVLYQKRSINGEWFSFSNQEIKAISFTVPPFAGARINNAEIYCFSNLEKDQVKPISSNLEFIETPAKSKTRAFHEACEEYLRENKLEKNKENLNLAREYVLEVYRREYLHRTVGKLLSE